MMALSEMGIDEIIVFCVNDAAVMDAWAKDQGIDEKVRGRTSIASTR